MSRITYGNIKAIIFSLLIVSILGYTYFQMRDLVTGPVITVTSPENGAVFGTAPVDIVGSTRNISEITLNDRDIFISEDGVFSEKLLLSPGYNIITLQAEDRFGRTTQKILELTYN